MPKRRRSERFNCRYFCWSLFQRNGVWYADGRSNTHRLGKHSLGTRDRDAAIEALHELDLRFAVEHGLATPRQATAEMKLSIERGWELYIEHCGLPEALGGVCENSLRRYKITRNRHVKYCRLKNVTHWEEVDKAHAAGFGTWMEKLEHAQRGIVFDVGRVRGVNIFLIESGVLPASANFKIKLVRPDGSDRYCYTREQVARMLQHCASTDGLGWLYDLIVVLACTGMRISETISLRRTDIDMQARTIVLTDERGSKLRQQLGTARRMKGRRSRVIPVNRQLYDLLSQIVPQPDGRVLHDGDGQALVDWRVRSVFGMQVIGSLKEEFPTPPGEIGFKHGCLHSFRHFFVSECFRQGATESQIMEWVGHKDSKIVALYRHRRPEDGLKQMSQLSFVDEQTELCEPVRGSSNVQQAAGHGVNRGSTAPRCRRLKQRS